MGYQLFDQFTYLHFASGIIAYFWGLSFWAWFVLHTIFEIVENTNLGIWTINHLIKIWPGGKPGPDDLTNIIGDTIGSIIGWLSAYYLDYYGFNKGWYNLHHPGKTYL